MDIREILTTHPCIHPVVADSTAGALAHHHISPVELKVGGNVVDARLEVSWTTYDESLHTTFQRRDIIEQGAIGVACLLLASYTDKRVTEVAKWGERADYYVGRSEGDRKEMLEVSGTDEGDLERRTREKRAQLLSNPHGKSGYVVTCRFCEPSASFLHERYRHERGDVL
ncbi:MAG: hypothetical protein HY318_16150 [Armatimonadetes bacterium]|nr:hypothetical protein [Armatimonadota bacterium]